MDILQLTDLKRQSKDTIKALNQIGYHDKADLMRGCGTQIEIGKTADGEEKIIFANFCKFRFCPLCIKRASIKRYYDLSDAWSIMTAQLDADDVDYDCIMFTGTIKNCKGNDLRKYIDYLLKAWANITHNLKWWGKYCIATARSLEITYNPKSKTYHPHIHCLCLFKRDWFKSAVYKTIPEWREMWKETLQHLGYFQKERFQIDVHKVKPREGSNNNGAIAEVSKYICKLPMVTQPEVLGTLIKQTKGVRFYSYTGLLKKIMADFEKRKSADQATNNDVFVAVMRYSWRGGCYVLLDDCEDY